MRVLESQPSPEAFCRTLEGLMRGYGFTFFIRGIPSSSTPVVNGAARKSKFRPAITSFQDQVEYGRFGGIFKEALVVACFSRRCYGEARTIMTEQTAGRQKVNAGLFAMCCGYRNEASLYQLLYRMVQGHMSRNAFKTALIENKNQCDDEPSDNQWKRKAEVLELENKKLKKELNLLKERLQKQDVAVAESTSNQMLMAEHVEDTESTSNRMLMAEHVEDNHSGDSFMMEDAENPYEFAESDISPPLPRRNQRRATYTVNYKPRSDSSSELHDSFQDPEWQRNDDSSQPDTSVRSEERPSSQPSAGISRRSRDLPQKKKVFTVGEKAEALFINKGKVKWEEWCSCEILGVIMNGQMYRVRFEDVVVMTVKNELVKKLPS